MNERERFFTTMHHKEPDKVPHFELVFQLTKEVFGRSFYTNDDYDMAMTGIEKERMVHSNLELYTLVCEKYNWCACPMYYLYDEESNLESIKIARNQYFKEKIVTATFNGEGTFGIPDGNSMLDLSYAFFDRPDEMKKLAEEKCRKSIEWGSRQIEAGAELMIINTDYAFNANPFLSPAMFSEFVTPFLERIVRAFKQEGAYVILHTDGNIMPIMTDIASVGLHGIQSIDPQGGMDIARVKKEYGDKLVLMGNVKCSLLQTGTEEEIRESVRYAVLNSREGGGYIFSSSNCIFEGMPVENYHIMLDEYNRLNEMK